MFEDEIDRGTGPQYIMRQMASGDVGFLGPTCDSKMIEPLKCVTTVRLCESWWKWDSKGMILWRCCCGGNGGGGGCCRSGIVFEMNTAAARIGPVRGETGKV